VSDSQQERNSLEQRFSDLCLKIESLWAEVQKRSKDLQRSDEIWELKKGLPAPLDPEQQDKYRRWAEEQGQILKRIEQTLASVKSLEVDAHTCFEDLAFHCADFSHAESDQANQLLQQFRKEVQPSLPEIEVGGYFFTRPETVRAFLAELRGLALRGRKLTDNGSQVPAKPVMEAQMEPATASVHLGHPAKKKRGPPPKTAHHRVVAKVVKPYGDKWRESDNLEAIANELDRLQQPIPPSWSKRDRKSYSWVRAVQNYPPLVIKAIEYRLKKAS